MEQKTHHTQIDEEIKNGAYRNCYLIYNRKSTDEPENQKNSIKYQKSENARFAFREHMTIANISIPGFCSDGIISEKHSAFKENSDLVFGNDGTIQYRIDRPKFFKLVQYLHRGSFKGVIVLCWDRISRNKGDETVIRKLMKSGIDFKFVLATYDKSSSGALHMDIDGMFAEHHSRVTSEKVSLNIRNQREKGICTYKAPVGYLNIGTMENKPFDPERASMIKKLFELYATGEYTLADLTRYAIQHGFTTAPMRRRKTAQEKLHEEEDDFLIHIEPISKIPTPNTIHKILINPFYTGKVKGNNGVYVKSISHEPLITEEIFQTVQNLLKKRKVSVHYANTLSYPLRGIIRCEICQRVYTPYLKKGIVYYGARCLKTCSNAKKSFNVGYITQLFGELIATLWLSDKEVKEYRGKQSKNIVSYERKRKNETEATERQIKKNKEDLSYLETNKLSLLKTGVYTPETYLTEQAKLIENIQKLENAEPSSYVINQENVKRKLKLSELLKNAYRLYYSGSFEQKDRLIRTVFSELNISHNNYTYQCKNGFQLLQNRFIPSCAQKARLLEFIPPYVDKIKQSTKELKAIIATAHAPPKNNV